MGGLSGLVSAVALLGFLMFLAGIGLVVVSASQGRSVRSGVVLAVVGLLFGIVLSVVSGGILIVEPQQRAVVFQTISGVLETPRGPGTHIIIPVLQNSTIYPIEIQEYTVAGTAEQAGRTGDDAVQVRTIDGQEVLIDVTVFYRISPSQIEILNQEGEVINVTNVNTVHINWQNRYEEQFIRPVLRGFVRDVVAGVRAEAVYATDRTRIQSQVEELMRQSLARQGFELTDLVIRNVTFSNAEFANSIEQVQIAERRALEAEFRVQQEAQEAERVRVRAQGARDAAIAEAEGQAQAIVLVARANAEGLRLVSEQIAANPSLIQYEYIRNLAPNVNLALIPTNSPFLFDFDSLAQAQADFQAPPVPEPEIPQADFPGLTPVTPTEPGTGSGTDGN
jgi:prohibitin 2